MDEHVTKCNQSWDFFPILSPIYIILILNVSLIHYIYVNTHTSMSLKRKQTSPIRRIYIFPILKVVIFFGSVQMFIANSGDPDQMQHCVASYLGLCCLPISSHK